MCRIITHVRFSQALPHLIQVAAADYSEDQKLLLKDIIEFEIWMAIEKMCANCGVDDDKYGVCGLHSYMVDYFFHRAHEQGMWERDAQVYLGAPA